MEKQYINLSGREIPLKITRNRRAKRISIRIAQSQQEVVLTLPIRASLHKAMDFLHMKADWVLTHVVDKAHNTQLIHGAAIPLLGEIVHIHRTDGRGVTHINAGVLHVYGAPEFTSRRVKDFLKKYLYTYCLPKAGELAEECGKTIRSVRICDTRSRWGSCNAKGDLQFHWRLVFAPLPILDYLIAHEVAHRVEMNHSQRFWKIVGKLYPDYMHARRWLKRSGPELHFYE